MIKIKTMTLSKKIIKIKLNLIIKMIIMMKIKMREENMINKNKKTKINKRTIKLVIIMIHKEKIKR
jgi:hypothetical protein